MAFKNSNTSVKNAGWFFVNDFFLPLFLFLLFGCPFIFAGLLLVFHAEEVEVRVLSDEDNYVGEIKE